MSSPPKEGLARAEAQGKSSMGYELGIPALVMSKKIAMC